MNSKRRKQIKKLTNELGKIQIEIELIRDEELEAMENTPESFEERIDEMQQCIDDMEDSLAEITSGIFCLENCL